MKNLNKKNMIPLGKIREHLSYPSEILDLKSSDKLLIKKLNFCS